MVEIKRTVSNLTYTQRRELEVEEKKKAQEEKEAASMCSNCKTSKAEDEYDGKPVCYNCYEKLDNDDEEDDRDDYGGSDYGGGIISFATGLIIVGVTISIGVMLLSEVGEISSATNNSTMPAAQVFESFSPMLMLLIMFPLMWVMFRPIFKSGF